jgi:hypothetical protein
MLSVRVVRSEPIINTGYNSPAFFDSVKPIDRRQDEMLHSTTGPMASRASMLTFYFFSPPLFSNLRLRGLPALRARAVRCLGVNAPALPPSRPTPRRTQIAEDLFYQERVLLVLGLKRVSTRGDGGVLTFARCPISGANGSSSWWPIVHNLTDPQLAVTVGADQAAQRTRVV